MHASTIARSASTGTRISRRAWECDGPPPEIIRSCLDNAIADVHEGRGRASRHIRSSPRRPAREHHTSARLDGHSNQQTRATCRRFAPPPQTFPSCLSQKPAQLSQTSTSGRAARRAAPRPLVLYSPRYTRTPEIQARCPIRAPIEMVSKTLRLGLHLVRKLIGPTPKSAV